MLRRLRRRPAAPGPAPDLDALEPADRAVIERALPHTLTGVARLQALVDAVRHLVVAGVPGGFAECGVWRGGSVLAMALTLQQLDAADRDLHLYDTFEGMTEPTEHDTSPFHPPALETWREGGRWEEALPAFDEEAVRALVLDSGYPAERVHLHRGPVEETLPAQDPGPLALLRLDTDWYESTRHELEHLYPRLASGGVLIVDDYGHWEGARRAVDEYFAAHGGAPLLHRVDYTCRLAVKR